jgi:hypothetical protein
MYRNKYLKYKSKYLNLNKLIGGTVPNCIKDHHENNIKDLKTAVLPIDTYLLHGNGLFNKLDVSTSKIYGDNKEIKFFNTTYNGSISYALTNKLDMTDFGYIGVYQVIEPIKIYAQNLRIGQFYFDSKDDYSSIKVQCLCDDDYNGYCSYDNLYDIKKIYDIGLCNYVGKIKLIGYVQIKPIDQQNIGSLYIYKYNEGEMVPNIDDSNLFLIGEKSIKMDELDKINKDNINKIYDTMIDIK